MLTDIKTRVKPCSALPNSVYISVIRVLQYYCNIRIMGRSMDSIICPNCNKKVEITKALKHSIEEKLARDLAVKHQEELTKIQKEIEDKTEKRIRQEQELRFRESKDELDQFKNRYEKVVQDLLSANHQRINLVRKDQERELEMQKKLLEERKKIQEETARIEKEKSNLETGELRKQLEDTKKALEDAQRKVNQKSQQLQGEVIEIELEQLLKTNFPNDEIAPIEKGISGADIRHVVKSPKGIPCGIILWEVKRTKEWSDKWIEKLKQDARKEGANISIIVSDQLPKDAKSGAGIKNGICICSYNLVLPIAILNRNRILEVAYQKAVLSHRDSKTENLYSYITSHEFRQQIESIVEAYSNMHQQILKEKMVFEKMWKQREMQAQRIILSTSNVIGNIQGRLGASMPPIKGLELSQLEDSDDQLSIPADV